MESKRICKWDVIAGTAFLGRQLFNTDCGHHLREKVDNDYLYKYCPYCGKQIEEVKDE